MNAFGKFKEIWLVDFEYQAPDGENPKPHCMVARELRSGRTLRCWGDELRRLKQAPFNVGSDALFVAYYLSAEMLCFLALGWEMPENVLDLYTEHRAATNGTGVRGSLLDALMHLGLDAMAASEKTAMRDLAIRGGPFTETEKTNLLAYCEEDVLALARLLPRMVDQLDLPRALLRGRYMKAAARMEYVGVPIDALALAELRQHWDHIKSRLVADIDADYGVFDGVTFKRDRWEAWLGSHGIPWLRLTSGALDLSDDTFRAMARVYPEVAPIRELRHALSELRLQDLAVGPDGRNRAMLSAFKAKTGRNQPSNTRFIFGPAVWLRGLIRPVEGTAVAYVDWSQQEFGIAAALSGDSDMMVAYETGDPYLAFAKRAGAVPPDATKKSHLATREQFKQASLAVQYGMAAAGLGSRLGVMEARAAELLGLHRRTYPRFWRWSDAVVEFAMLNNYLYTVFGWPLHITTSVEPIRAPALRNFPMQGNGAEMLRLACCFATERGVRVCAPVHDALLIEASLVDLDAALATTQGAMSDASAAVLGGFRLRSDVKVIRHPDHYEDERGLEMWTTVWKIIAELQGSTPPELGAPA